MSIFLMSSLPIFQLFEVLGAMNLTQPQFKGSEQYVAERPACQWRLQAESGGPSGCLGPFWWGLGLVEELLELLEF